MRRALVTGCSSGIGRACALELARRGYTVVATARDPSSLDDLPVAERRALDVTDDGSVSAVAVAAGDVDLLVSNAGITAWAPVELLPIDLVRRVFDTNVLGFLRIARSVLPGMRARRRGRVIAVSSAALRGFPLLGAYAASKAALEALVESMRLEVAGLGVEVLLAEPGPVISSFAANRTVVEIDDADYAPMAAAARAVLDGMRTTPMTSEAVAAEIADLAERDAPPLRTPIGPVAERIVGERHTVGDPDYEAAVRTAMLEVRS
jgi:NAD(P)-dependent dehydrogenase (short-subunit alcohol dehydrogenase family)